MPKMGKQKRRGLGKYE